MSDIFDAHAGNYSESIDRSLAKFGGKHDFFMAHKAWLLGELMRQNNVVPSESKLLDVGCGTGLLHGHISGKLASLSGVDVSKESIKVASRTYPTNRYQHYDGRQLPFDAGEFDLATAIAVFHHVPPADWQLVANEMVRVTRPGGLLVVIEHNPFNPVTRHIVNTCDLDKDAVLLRPKTLRNLFANAGAETVMTRTVLSVPPINRTMKGIDALCGRLPFGAQYYLSAKSPAPANLTSRPK